MSLNRAVRFISGLVFAHLLTSAEVVIVLLSLGHQTSGGAQSLVPKANLMPLLAVTVLGTVLAAAGGYRIIAPALRWFDAGLDPDPDQRRAAINIIRNQSVLLMSIWLLSGVVFIIANGVTGWLPILLIEVSVLFGGISTASSSLLFTQRVTRPVVAAATRDFESRTTAPGVQARLVLMWTLSTALPSATIAIMVVCRANGWLIPATASVDVPVVLLSMVSVFLGLRTLMLVSLSISDPLREIIDAMAEVEQGHIGTQVAVYEQSEIGRLQRGFNRMVTGLQERDRLRDLFGRHVGPDVARLAVEMTDHAGVVGDDVLSGDVREVAVLFVDVTGSTALAMTRTPAEVAAVFNDFFRIVVAAVDAHDGLINKFQGDAALAVFGAPIPSERTATSALAAARALAAALGRQELDYGIGVSAGPAFAGNIGAENRYEYTVIGDPVNEAARLADAAKTTRGASRVRVLPSTAPMTRSAATGAPTTSKFCAGGPNRRSCSCHDGVMSDIAPFQISVTDDDLADLTRRLSGTRWPEAECVDNWSQGIPLDYTRELARYWAHDYDWRAREAALNGFGQFTTAVDGLDIHFIHQRSPHEDALPLLITHGWPGSVVEFAKVIGPLTDPTAHGGRAEDAFHVVCPSLPGYGFSGKPTSTGWGVQRIAQAWDTLMGRLGYPRYGAQGGDWGAAVTTQIGRNVGGGSRSDGDIGGCVAIHTNMPIGRPPAASLESPTAEDIEAFAAMKAHRTWGTGYSKQQSTRPQTLGYGLVDSPVAQLAWIVEKFWAWSDCDGHPENVLTRDELLDNVMLYWVTRAGASSARLYWESFTSFGAGDRVEVPTGVAAFPKEIVRTPRSWCEDAYNITHWTNMPRGGHFAAFEQPELFVDDVRTFFSTVR